MKKELLVISITEFTLEKFKIKWIRHSKGIYLDAVLTSPDNRFVAWTKTEEVFDKKTGKCYKMGLGTSELINDMCRYELLIDSE